MRACIVSLSMVVLFCSTAGAQVKNAATNLKAQAIKIGAAFLKGDYTTFAAFTYPGIIKLMGGTDKFKEVLAKSIHEMKSQGISFSKVTFDEPSKIVKQGKEWQATIKQHLELKLPKEKLLSTSMLIAISTDNGNNWTFIDVSKKDAATLRKAFPNISPQLNIEPQQLPLKIPS